MLCFCILYKVLLYKRSIITINEFLINKSVISQKFIWCEYFILNNCFKFTIIDFIE